VTLPADVDAEALHRESRRAGIAYTRGELFHLGGGGRRNLSLSFACLDEPEIAAGLEALGALAKRARRRKPR
jgi:DNA-binding transcriptional MocR family regulator